MKAFFLRLRPQSAWASPWHADTLFGSLAWTWRYVHGNDSLESLLDLMRSGNPPLVISDAFPGDLLPFPLGAVAAVRPGEKKKALWVTRETFLSFASGNAAALEVALDGADPYQAVTRLQNSLGRDSDSTEGGELFQVDTHTLNRGRHVEYLTLYLRCAPDWLDRLCQVLAVFESRGFGRRASIGLGAFAVEGALEPCAWLDAGPAAVPPNGYMALSHFLPAANDPSHGSWRLHLTHPKFHSPAIEKFLKGSFLMLRPGSVFRTPGLPEPWYGRVCPLKSEELPKAVQYGLTLAAPVALPSSWLCGYSASNAL